MFFSRFYCLIMSCQTAVFCFLVFCLFLFLSKANATIQHFQTFYKKKKIPKNKEKSNQKTTTTINKLYNVNISKLECISCYFLDFVPISKLQFLFFVFYGPQFLHNTETPPYRTEHSYMSC